MVDAVVIFGMFEQTFNAILSWISVPILGGFSVLDMVISMITVGIVIRFLILPIFGKYSFNIGSGGSSSAERPQNRYGKAVDSRNRKVSVRWDTDFKDSV